jgi:hypothetical protein
VFRVQASPTIVVETFRIVREVLVREPCRVLDVLKRENFTSEVRFDDVLQPGHFRMVEKAAARADVRINVPRVRRILPPVAELVAVGVQNRIELQRLNDILPGTSTGNEKI